MFESLRSQYKSFSSRRKIRREKPEIWLLEDKKVGYVQIPKVATRSIRASLSKSILEGQGVFVDYDELDGQMVKGVEQYSTIRATQAHIQKLRSEYFIFSFISIKILALLLFVSSKLHFELFVRVKIG